MTLEELQLRNYAETTIDSYIRALEDFPDTSTVSPDRLAPRKSVFAMRFESGATTL
jgi:hypothetical protein